MFVSTIACRKEDAANSLVVTELLSLVGVSQYNVTLASKIEWDLGG